MVRAHERIERRDAVRPPGRTGPTGGAAILRLQRQAGNAAVSAALGGATVQRKLQLTGPSADVATVLKMLQQATGLGLRRDAKSIVTMTGVIGKQRSKALATHLMLIVGDPAQTAKVALTRSGDELPRTGSGSRRQAYKYHTSLPLSWRRSSLAAALRVAEELLKRERAA